ncbi:3-deoxy-D-manno-octulosonic-acid transferase [Pseudorhodobacter antarcticus]|uniref:3-deoxy-D-manno-octulosonic acid transferase n=1 Tax=Pseudorhodobacter antarcticus TaxID=1077947 RepID=A0A1H8BV65_9RHOB|nr:glycosyltransferase N-terminal domain-containing protein [Pseudorhodobacter antarcticus]SEM85757.1 3-deoxy-D-manno-octulosonic-acid transferase [Pseudorhodobacter antarcticus]
MTGFPGWRLRIALWAYAVLWGVGLPFVLLYLWRRGRKDADYRGHIAERFGIYGAPMPGAVWVHAVSLGEFRSAVPLIDALLARGERVVVTHFTPAGRRSSLHVYAAQIAAGRVRVVWVPFDMGLWFVGFFRSFRPQYGLVMEVEIWPGMIMAARARGVPLFMCNAQYPSKSYARDGQTGLRAQVMRGFAGALVKSEMQAQRFGTVGVQNIEITGELRFDQPIPAHLVAAGVRVAPLRDVVVIASAIEGEDAGYIAAIKAVQAARDTLFVYVPRRPERFDAVAADLSAAGLRVARRSAVLGPDLAGDLPDDIDVFFGDSLGEMYFYLAMATRVVVGGGFNPKGAHNIIEPLALKKPVLVGPETFTIEYPFEEARAAGVAQSVPDAAALAAALIARNDPTPAQIEAFFAAHAGATQRTLAGISTLLA